MRDQFNDECEAIGLRPARPFRSIPSPLVDTEGRVAREGWRPSPFVERGRERVPGEHSTIRPAGPRAPTPHQRSCLESGTPASAGECPSLARRQSSGVSQSTSSSKQEWLRRCAPSIVSSPVAPYQEADQRAHSPDDSRTRPPAASLPSSAPSSRQSGGSRVLPERRRGVQSVRVTRRIGRRFPAESRWCVSSSDGSGGGEFFIGDARARFTSYRGVRVAGRLVALDVAAACGDRGGQRQQYDGDHQDRAARSAET